MPWTFLKKCFHIINKKKELHLINVSIITYEKRHQAVSSLHWWLID